MLSINIRFCKSKHPSILNLYPDTSPAISKSSPEPFPAIPKPSPEPFPLQARRGIWRSNARSA